MYKVSMLVPFFNPGQYFERCVRSLFEQTYQHLEYVFIDDSSTDGSAHLLKSLVKEYACRPDRIIIAHHDTNLGIAASRNEAIEKATGDFVCFVDADDWVEPDMVEQLVTKQTEGDYDMVWCDAVMHTNEGNHLLTEPLYKDRQTMINTYCCLTAGYTMVLWRRLIRRSLFTTHNIHCATGFNYAEDKVLLSQVAYYTERFGKVDKPLYHYNRMNTSSLVAQWNRQFNADIFRQEVHNIETIEEFFSSKESNYYESCATAKLHYLKEHLDQALQASSREGFRIAVGHINASNPAFWSTIGWNRGKWHRRLYSNYFYMKYSPRIKQPVKRLLNSIK